ncbi:MAG: DUF3368 domain-containing protein [Chloroflexi bacterium]|nr:DUF3368 domain-containing protein [Chloroflexota bacterium]
MTVVSNTSPIINLARISQLDLLRRIYSELLIPEAVWQEIVVHGAGQPGADETRQATWIHMRAVSNRALVQSLRQELDAGEAEAIALALEVGAEALVMDERLGRETARHLGLRCVGLVGVLVAAKHQGRITAIKPPLDLLRSTANFRVFDALYERVLRDEGELL